MAETRSSAVALCDPCHRVSIYVLSVAEGVQVVGAFDLEPELLIQRNPGGVYKHENTRAQLPRPADGQRRRAVGVGEGLRLGDATLAAFLDKRCGLVGPKSEPGAFFPLLPQAPQSSCLVDNVLVALCVAESRSLVSSLEACAEGSPNVPGEPVEYEVEWIDHGAHDGEPEFCSGCGHQLVFIVTWDDVPGEPPHGKGGTHEFP